MKVRELLLQGDAFFNQENWEAAITAYTKVLALDPEYVPALTRRGTSYHRQGNLASAIADLTQAIQIIPRPDNAHISYIRGAIYRLHNQPEMALLDLNMAIELNPQLADAYASRGKLYYARKAYKLAISDFTANIKMNDVLYEDDYIDRGDAYSQEGRYDAALEDYTAAIKLHPGNAVAFICRGVLYFEQENWALAIADFTQSFELDSSDVDALYFRAKALYMQGQLELAMTDYLRAIELARTQDKCTWIYPALCDLAFAQCAALQLDQTKNTFHLLLKEYSLSDIPNSRELQDQTFKIISSLVNPKLMQNVLMQGLCQENFLAGILNYKTKTILICLENNLKRKQELFIDKSTGEALHRALSRIDSPLRKALQRYAPTLYSVLFSPPLPPVYSKKNKQILFATKANDARPPVRSDRSLTQ